MQDLTLTLAQVRCLELIRRRCPQEFVNRNRCYSVISSDVSCVASWFLWHVCRVHNVIRTVVLNGKPRRTESVIVNQRSSFCYTSARSPFRFLWFRHGRNRSSSILKMARVKGFHSCFGVHVGVISQRIFFVGHS